MEARADVERSVVELAVQAEHADLIVEPETSFVAESVTEGLLLTFGLASLVTSDCLAQSRVASFAVVSEQQSTYVHEERTLLGFLVHKETPLG